MSTEKQDGHPEEKDERMCGACSVLCGRDRGLYTPAADPYLLPSAEAVACTAHSAGG